MEFNLNNNLKEKIRYKKWNLEEEAKTSSVFIRWPITNHSPSEELNIKNVDNGTRSILTYHGISSDQLSLDSGKVIDLIGYMHESRHIETPSFPFFTASPVVFVEAASLVNGTIAYGDRE